MMVVISGSIDVNVFFITFKFLFYFKIEEKSIFKICN